MRTQETTGSREQRALLIFPDDPLTEEWILHFIMVRVYKSLRNTVTDLARSPEETIPVSRPHRHQGRSLPGENVRWS